MHEPHIAVEFQALVQDGVIVIPEPYRASLSGIVRVLILQAPPAGRSKIIERLMADPIQDPDFRPLRRDDIYHRAEP
jgi:hypothetical protein